MNTLSIRSHLILLVVAVSAPLVAVVGLDIFYDMKETIDYTKTSLRAMTGMMVSNTDGRIANARQILERMAARPQVRRLDAGHCDGILKDLRSLNLSFADVGYTNLQGRLGLLGPAELRQQTAQSRKNGVVPGLQGEPALYHREAVFRSGYRQVGGHPQRTDQERAP